MLQHATSYITKNYKSFNAPFLILHGKNDMVTDPNLSQAFYDDSKSPDKEIKLYDGTNVQSYVLIFSYFCAFEFFSLLIMPC